MTDKSVGNNDKALTDMIELPSSKIGGGSLRAAREAKGLTIADVAAELRIPKSYLIALEEETYDELPGATYGFGYIRSYCKLLNIDAQPLLDVYKMQVSRQDAKPDYHFPDEVLEPRMSGAMASMLLVLVLLAGYLGWHVLDNFNLNPLTQKDDVQIATLTEDGQSVSVIDDKKSEATLVIDAQEQAPAEAELAQDELNIVAAAVQGDEEAASAQEETNAADEATDTGEAAVVVADVSETAAPEETKAEDKAEESAPALQASVEEEPATKIASQEDSSQQDASQEKQGTPATAALATAREPEAEIVISAIAPSWVEVVRENGDIVLNKLFKEGDRYVSPANEKIYLSTGNAGGLILTLPGLDEFNMGETGEIIRDLPLSRESLRSRRSAQTN